MDSNTDPQQHCVRWATQPVSAQNHAFFFFISDAKPGNIPLWGHPVKASTTRRAQIWSDCSFGTKAAEKSARGRCSTVSHPVPSVKPGAEDGGAAQLAASHGPHPTLTHTTCHAAA